MSHGCSCKKRVCHACTSDTIFLCYLFRHLENMPLNWINYWQRFKLLLHIEELQKRTEIEKLSQDSCYTLKVLLVSCIVLSCRFLSLHRAHQLSCLSLSVHSTTRVNFECRFLSCFKEGMRFHISFAINRMPLRNQHRAAELVYKCRLREVLFPTGQSAFELENNPEQRKAVEHIVAASAKPAPYLVFGPPGTGKTVTLVEAIKRIVKTRPSCNILACAPSNSATDNLCEKILQDKIAKPSVYRLYALSCSVTKIPEMIKSCCNLNQKTKRFEIPLKAELMSHKIMVTSLQTASRLVSKGIPSAHYSYLFVDEASYSAETECLIPLAGLLKPHKCQVVLAGDPKQLGPIISSMLAETHGLGVSMLERLMNIDLYKRHETYGFNNRFISKLLRNYRSHPAILKVPNELFYDGELQSYADTKTTSSFCRWEQLPRKGFPLIFHGVAGTNERDSNDPSVYNMAEVDVLKEYLKALVAHFHKKGVNKIEPNNIGIIVPYRKQVEKINKRTALIKLASIYSSQVGSVEQFQGKEFNVTLVSTVRSMTKLTAANQKFTLGFVDNERRFNVAMTRAQALLIVVGDPRVLKTDHNWNTFIHYCATNGCYRGITVSDAEEDHRASGNMQDES
uniref:RNA helicase n=1 Tax=Gasterosteus aculeatus aculeatus TaxID=481459 RepID=A0AAQ4NWJ7_GASAC